MQTRDFVMNEILVHGEYIYATPDALSDLYNKIIRPTEYVKESWYNYELDTRHTPPKLIMKALRMELEFAHYYGEAEIQDIAEWEFSTDAVPAFYIALQLERAFENGDKIANDFLT